MKKFRDFVKQNSNLIICACTAFLSCGFAFLAGYNNGYTDALKDVEKITFGKF